MSGEEVREITLEDIKRELDAGRFVEASQLLFGFVESEFKKLFEATIPEVKSELVKRIEVLEKSVEALKPKFEVVSRFTSEEASVIAKEFSGVLKALSESATRLAEKGIGFESKFSAKDGVLTVQLFKIAETEGEINKRVVETKQG